MRNLAEMRKKKREKKVCVIFNWSCLEIVKVGLSPLVCVSIMATNV